MPKATKPTYNRCCSCRLRDYCYRNNKMLADIYVCRNYQPVS